MTNSVLCFNQLPEEFYSGFFSFSKPKEWTKLALISRRFSQVLRSNLRERFPAFIHATLECIPSFYEKEIFFIEMEHLCSYQHAPFGIINKRFLALTTKRPSRIDIQYEVLYNKNAYLHPESLSKDIQQITLKEVDSEFLEGARELFSVDDLDIFPIDQRAKALRSVLDNSYSTASQFLQKIIVWDDSFKSLELFKYIPKIKVLILRRLDTFPTVPIILPRSFSMMRKLSIPAGLRYPVLLPSILPCLVYLNLSKIGNAQLTLPDLPSCRGMTLEFIDAQALNFPPELPELEQLVLTRVDNISSMILPNLPRCKTMRLEQLSRLRDIKFSSELPRLTDLCIADLYSVRPFLFPQTPMLKEFRSEGDQSLFLTVQSGVIEERLKKESDSIERESLRSPLVRKVKSFIQGHPIFSCATIGVGSFFLTKFLKKG